MKLQERMFALMGQWQKSDLLKREFLIKTGVGSSKFDYWHKKYNESKKGKNHLGYYWIYHSPLKKMIVFDYQRGRDANAPKKILENFKGFLQTDGYAVYRQYGHKNRWHIWLLGHM